MLLTSLDAKRTLMHLFLFKNSAQRELVTMCTQSIHDRNQLSLHYNLGSLEQISKFNIFKNSIQTLTNNKKTYFCLKL